MRLLITGGCGFIGSNFINYYFQKTKEDLEILVNIDAMYYCANKENILPEIRDNEKYVFIKGNINSVDLLDYVLNKYKISHIIHYAAQSHVQNSFDDSIKFTVDNVLGTHTLLESCRKYGKIKKFIHVSTDEVYGESMNDIKTEHSILCPTNPYAGTKAAAELIAQSYYYSYKLPIIITRGNNVYGVNQYPEKVIPLFIKQLTTGEKITIQGDGSAVRAFLHVDDTISAFELILEHGEIGEIYNIGCDENMEYSVLEIARILIQLIKKTDDYQPFIEYIIDRPFNDRRYYISNDKLKKIGWEIKTDLITGLTRLINAPNQGH
jgi:dTDP-glucose 4,6-dehydratase/UDP-glucose 4,6-dehydratase